MKHMNSVTILLSIVIFDDESFIFVIILPGLSKDYIVPVHVPLNKEKIAKYCTD